MSSHDMAVRGTLKVKPEVTLPLIWAAITIFTDHFDIKLAEGEEVPNYGEMSLSYDNEQSVELTEDGTLSLYLSCHAGHGEEPNFFENLVEALDGMVLAGGALEIVDHDTSAANGDAIWARFVGADDTQRIYARLAYGLERGREWLVDVIDPSGFEQLSQLAKNLADAKLAKA